MWAVRDRDLNSYINNYFRLVVGHLRAGCVAAIRPIETHVVFFDDRHANDVERAWEEIDRLRTAVNNLPETEGAPLIAAVCVYTHPKLRGPWSHVGEVMWPYVRRSDQSFYLPDTYEVPPNQAHVSVVHGAVVEA